MRKIEENEFPYGKMKKPRELNNYTNTTMKEN